MALDVGVNVIYQSDTSKPKAAWDEFITYTQQHQPTWTVAGHTPGAPGSGPATASTFGGLSGIAPSAGSPLGAGFGTPGTQANAATVAVQAAVLHQQAQQNAQDFVNRLAQMSAVPPNVTAGGGGGYRSWLAQEIGSQSSDIGRASVLDNEARATRRLQSGFSPGSPGFDAYGRDADAYEARAARYRENYGGLGGNAIIPYRRPLNYTMAGPGTALATTDAGQGGPGAVGGGGRMWVPIGNTPDFQIPGYGAGRRARRAMRRNGLVEDDDQEEGPEDGPDRPDRPDRPEKPTIPKWAKAAAAAWAVEHYITGVVGSQNAYNIGMAGATTLPQMLAAKSANIYSGLESVPLIGGALGAGAEYFLGYRQQLAGQVAQYEIGQGTFGLRAQGINSGGAYNAQQFSSIGNATGDPRLIRQGIGFQAEVDASNSYNDLQVNSYPRKYAIAELNQKEQTEGLSDEEQRNRNSLFDQQVQANALQRQQATQIYGAASASMFSNEYGVSVSNLGSGYDIDARNRRTQASAFSGQFQPMTGAAMDEITAARTAVQQFNMTHVGADYADVRAQNTASVIAQQQQSYANLQFQAQAPGNAQEVSSMTSFGDFTNIGYNDYQNALAASAKGGADIQDASDSSNTAMGDLAAQLETLVNALPDILQAINMVVNWGNAGN